MRCGKREFKSIVFCLFSFPFPLLLISARGITETTPSFMYPYGTSSSQMVLRGVDLLLECIASGVYVPHPGWGTWREGCPQLSPVGQPWDQDAESPVDFPAVEEKGLFRSLQLPLPMLS